MTASYRYTLEGWECPPEGEPLDVELDLDVESSPYDPGRISGPPPELCYPPEGGEIESLTIGLVKAASAITGEPVRPDLLSGIEQHLQDEYDKGGALQKRLDEFVYDQPPPEPDYDYDD